MTERKEIRAGDLVSWRRSGGSWATFTVARIENNRVYDSDGTWIDLFDVVRVDGEQR